MLIWLFTHTPLFFLTQPFWRDEAFTYFLAKKNILDIIFFTARDFNPPLYYLILHYWMNIFGGSEIAMRSLSLLFFWGTIYIAFLFLNKIFKFSEKKSIFYLLLFIINPLLLYYAFEARMYTMFAFFSALSYYSFLKKDNKTYLLATIAGLFTHYFMIFVVLSQLAFLSINKDRYDLVKQKLAYLSLIIFSPWLIFFIFQNRLSSSFWIERPHLKDIFGLLGIIYTGNESLFYNGQIATKILQIIIYSSLLLTLILGVGVYLYFKKFHNKDRQIFLFLAIWGVGIAIAIGLISFIKPIFFPRYLIFTNVGFLLLLIYILEKFNFLSRFILIAILLGLTFNYNKLQIEYRKKSDLRKTLAEIQILASQKDFIYTNDLDYFTVQYYLRSNKVRIYGKSFEEIPAYVGKTLIPKNAVASSLPFYPQKAFILNENGEYTIRAMY